MNKRFILMKEQLQIMSDNSFITQLLAKENVTIDLWYLFHIAEHITINTQLILHFLE